MRPEHHALATELEDIFRKSLQEYPSAADCSDWWRRSDAGAKARKFLEVNEEASAVFRNGQSRIAVINRPTLVHMFWLLDLDASVVEQYVALLLDTSINRSFPHTKFWSAYSQAIAIFCGVPATAGPKPKLVGYEKFWEPYLDFMAGSISREEFSARAATSFAARNQQSRCIDWLNLDGDGKKPVKWDFRYASILRKTEQDAARNSRRAEQSIGL